MKLGQVALTVDNLAESVAFHRDVLGLPMLYEYPGLAFFDMGGVRLMLSAAGNEPERHESVLYYRVDDLQSAWRSLLDKGARPEGDLHMVARMPDHELWMGIVRDPENRLVGIMSEVRN